MSSHVSSTASLVSTDGSHGVGPLSPLSTMLAQEERQRPHQSQHQQATTGPTPSSHTDRSYPSTLPAGGASYERASSPTSTLALTAITDSITPEATSEPQTRTDVDGVRPAPPSSFPRPNSLPLTASFDPFPGLTQARHQQPPRADSYQPASASPFDYGMNAAGQPETPSDILHYYQSYSEARRQIVSQSLATVRTLAKAWTMLTVLAKDKAAKARLVKPKEAIAGARHSTLAASYMSMVQAQQEQQQARDQAAALEIQLEEDEEALEAEDEEVIAPLGTAPTVENLPLPRSHHERKASQSSVASSSAASRALNVVEMEKAVQIAHHVKLLRETEEAERAKAEEEEKRYQQQIAFAQQKLESEAQAMKGESMYMHLQEESKSVPNVPLRIGIIGCGSLGARIAGQLLEQFCGVSRDGKTPPPSHGHAHGGSHGARVFISTRRPDHPAVVELVKRAGGTSGASGTHGQGGIITVYFDNARLVTECNVILICTLPHQVQLLSSTLRALSPACRPRSQLFFSITSSHTPKALHQLLGEETCLARTILVLPHLMLKDSSASSEAADTFSHSICSSLSRALSRHSSFSSLLGSDGIERVVNGFRRDLEREVQHCFEKEATRPPSSMDPMATASVGATFALVNKRIATSNAGSLLASPASASTSSSALHSPAGGKPHGVFSPSSSSSFAPRSVSQLGLSPSSLPATAGGVVLPKLKDLKRQQAAQQQREEEKEARPRATRQHQPAGGRSGESMQAHPFPQKTQAKERARLFDAQF